MSESNQTNIQNKMRNRGHHIINPPEQASETKTVIVLGCARSGTTMIAGVLHHLGVSVGRRHDDATFEDIDLSLAFENHKFDEAESIIAEYNEAHDVWAWKRPGLLDYQNIAAKHVRNPHYIAIFKDIFAISNRNRISMEVDLLENMDSVISDHRKLLEILKSLDAPCLMLSNEKVLQNKSEAVATIADFIGKGSAAQREAAVEFITPNRTKYLESTRKNRNIGFLDKVTDTVVAGWARSAYTTDTKVEVELLVNGKAVKKSVANLYREDLKQGNHGDGHHGYIIPTSDLKLKAGDKISVRVTGDIVDLSNSPLPYPG